LRRALETRTIPLQAGAPLSVSSPLSKNTSVGLVSSTPIRQIGLASSFENHPSIEIENIDLVSVVDNRALTYLILDLAEDKDWMEALTTVRRSRQDLRLIVIGPGSDAECMLRAIAGGARAYLDPSCGQYEVKKATECVIEGYIWATRRVLSIFIDRLLAQSLPTQSRIAMPLSPREKQVLNLITNGSSNRQIGEDLGIEERTVKAYVSSLFRKVGVENRVSLSVETLRGSHLDKQRLRDS